MGSPTRQQVEVVVRLPVELHEALQARAKAEDRSMAAVIRVALRRYVAAHDQDHRVLWEGETKPNADPPSRQPGSYVHAIVADPPGTVVAVVTRPDTQEER